MALCAVRASGRLKPGRPGEATSRQAGRQGGAPTLAADGEDAWGDGAAHNEPCRHQQQHGGVGAEDQQVCSRRGRAGLEEGCCKLHCCCAAGLPCSAGQCPYSHRRSCRPQTLAGAQLHYTLTCGHLPRVEPALVPFLQPNVCKLQRPLLERHVLQWQWARPRVHRRSGCSVAPSQLAQPETSS